jgi:hypothetical protein
MALHNVRERCACCTTWLPQCDVWRENGLFQARIVLPAP